MSDAFLLYLFTRLDTVVGILGFWGSVCAIIAIVCVVGTTICVVSADDSADGRVAERALPFFRKGRTAFVWAAAVLGVLYMVTPTSKNMAVIVGGVLTLEAIRSPTAKEIGGEVLEVVRAKLKEAAK